MKSTAARRRRRRLPPANLASTELSHDHSPPPLACLLLCRVFRQALAALVWEPGSWSAGPHVAGAERARRRMARAGWLHRFLLEGSNLLFELKNQVLGPRNRVRWDRRPFSLTSSDGCWGLGPIGGTSWRSRGSPSSIVGLKRSPARGTADRRGRRATSTATSAARSPQWQLSCQICD